VGDINLWTSISSQDESKRQANKQSKKSRDIQTNKAKKAEIIDKPNETKERK
jgi:hypothetical protein